MLWFRDLERLEEQADRSHGKVRKGKCTALDCWWPRDWKQLCREGPGAPGWQQVEHEP